MLTRWTLWIFFAIPSTFCWLPSTAYATTHAIIEPSEPIVIEVSGTLKPLIFGQQAIIATTVQSNANETRTYVVIIEVRNSNRITENLNWHSGQLAPHEASQVGVSWIPQEAGAYEIRTFVLNGLKNPQLYSAVVTSNIDVGSGDMHFENQPQYDHKEVPNLILVTENGRLFQGEEGTYCLTTRISMNNVTTVKCADSILIVPQNVITLDKDSKVQFQTFDKNATLNIVLPWVTNDQIKHPMGLNSTTTSSLGSDNSPAFVMDLPKGDYNLTVEARWTFGNSEGHSYYFYRVHIR